MVVSSFKKNGMIIVWSRHGNLKYLAVEKIKDLC